MPLTNPFIEGSHERMLEQWFPLAGLEQDTLALAA
jgi:hypothetical protein